MKLTIDFTSTDNLVKWLSLLTPAQQALMGNAAVGVVGAPVPAVVPAVVTPAKQEAARQSTGKADPPATATTFEKSGLAELILNAQIKNVDAAKGVLISNGGVLKGKPNGAALKPEVYDKVRAELQAIIDGNEVIGGEPAATPDDPPPPAPDYFQSGIKEKILALQTREGMRDKLRVLLEKMAPADAEGKHKASSIPPDRWPEMHKELDKLAAE